MSAEYLNSLFGLEGQVAVVIGGTGTLGGALASGLAQAGAYVVIAGRELERGVECVEQLQAAGGDGAFVSVDVLDRASMERLAERAQGERGRVDMLVNCVGTNHFGDYLDVTDEDFDRVMQVNLRSTHLGCQVFGRLMADAGGGSILNIGSASAEIPLSGVFAYSASKAAVVNLTRNVARELAPQNVRVNALCPGFFPAEQNRAILTPERTEAILRHTPMARFGDPQELIGAALLLLARAAGSFITGAVYHVDGGFTAMTI